MKERRVTMPKVTQKEDITRIWAMGSICISDLPEGSVYTSPANGKKYLNITIQSLNDVKEFRDKIFTHEIKAGSRDNQKTIGNMTEYKKEVSSEPEKTKEEPAPVKTKPAKKETPITQSGGEDNLPF